MHQISGDELHAAIAFASGLADAVVARPVSTLQMRFRLGYGHACALAQAMEAAGFWTIGVDEQGGRVARCRLRPALPAIAPSVPR